MKANEIIELEKEYHLPNYRRTPFILTKGTGGPDNATYLVPMLIYHNAFEYLRMGYACAASCG